MQNGGQGTANSTVSSAVWRYFCVCLIPTMMLMVKAMNKWPESSLK